MKKLLSMLLCLTLLLVPVRAEPERYIALTFDDGPSGRFTRELLEGLASRGVHATFFLCGYRLETYGDLAQKIRDDGHEIGIHGYSHDSMAVMDADCLRSEIFRTAEMIPGKSILLRPPGGCAGETVSEIAAEAGLSLILWSVDPRDWADHDSATVTDRVVQCAGDGDIILLHDMSDSSVEAAFQIIDTLSARGYRFCTVSELAAIKGYTLCPGKAYYSFP